MASEQKKASNGGHHHSSNNGTRRSHHSSDHLRSHLTKEMLEEVEEIFRTVVDGNGHMPASKLPLCLKALGMSLNETNEDISDYQSDGVTLDKFIAMVVDCLHHPNWAANEMNEAYMLFDKDGNGYINSGELKRVFYKIGENLTDMECEDQLRAIDIDGDTQMVIAEYYKMISNTKGSDFNFEEH